MRRALLFAALIAMTSLAQAAPAPRYDGIFVITALAGAGCPAAFGKVGDAFTAVFRAKLTAIHPPEGVSFVVPRGAVIIRVKGGDGNFRGAAVGQVNFVADAGLGALPDSNVNLTFTPANITAATVNFDVRGTATNFGAPACTATLRGSFTRQP